MKNSHEHGSAVPPLGKPVDLRQYLDGIVREIETPAFLRRDPVSVPHGFDDPRDQEVVGLFTALLAWGRRETILNKMADLCERMHYRPFRFIADLNPERERRLEGFCHRTFNDQDALWLSRSLSALLRRHGSTERVFASFLDGDALHVGDAIEGFSRSVMTAVEGVPHRLGKHLARPSSGSACKRLNMYLRWMVRPGPVDFGNWTSIHPSQLVLPLDVHAGRSARSLGLLTRSVNDWKAALELTERCRAFCPEDPARYDFAFFGVPASGESFDPTFTASGGRSERA